MKMIVTTIVAGLISSHAFAGPDCTTEPKEKWQDQKAFQENLKKEGYKIKKFKVTKGNCYEIYGWNKEGKKVEIYFNPISGEHVKEIIE
ncbi:MAG: PepSY domain-containing protein [Oligoflexia bacterium]|nr:PepSY domain-containing protein [Oligoflexia bacterium]